MGYHATPAMRLTANHAAPTVSQMTTTHLEQCIMKMLITFYYELVLTRCLLY